MRCKNCGWENPDNLQQCEKCNSPLDAGSIHNHQSPSHPEREAVLRGTISEQQVFDVSDQSNHGNNRCPQCGYPIREGTHHCPNCGHDLAAADSPKDYYQKEIKSPNHKPNATINPWANRNHGRIFKLEPVAWEGEKDTKATLSFMGESVELNRYNTDPANNTITSKVQAEISCENGTWFIEDKSAQGSSFIQAKRKIALENGDVIMLGDRKFIFKIE